MSVPFGRRISKADARALPGRFRLLMMAPSKQPTDYFNMGDYSEKYGALDAWRKLLRKKRDRAVKYIICDDQGRQVDAVGTIITEEERKAPPGKFRVICGDIASGVIWLVVDLDDRDEAIDYAKTADEGPYTGFQIHDDTGAALIPV